MLTELRRLMEIARESLEDSGEVMPHAYAHGPEGLTVMALADMPATARERQIVMFSLGNKYAQQAEWVAFVSDTWGVRMAPGQQRSDFPADLSEAPERFEQIVGVLMTPDESLVAVELPYERDGDRIVWDEPSEDVDGMMGAPILRALLVGGKVLPLPDGLPGMV